MATALLALGALAVATSDLALQPPLLEKRRTPSAATSAAPLLEKRRTPSVAASAAPLLPAANRSVCVSGVAMPQLFILGMEKAGTSELLTWLGTTGQAADACPGSKIGPNRNSSTDPECHAYDKVCGFSIGKRATDEIGSCPTKVAEPDAAVAQFRQQGHACGASPTGPAGTQILVDKSPTYSRLFGLPSYLSLQYGAAQAKQLRFVVLLRDPLDRMVSSVFQRFKLSNDKIGGPPVEALVAQSYAASMIARLPPSYAALCQNVYSSPIARKYDDDFFYRSLYAVQLKPWLSAVDPRQLLILPFNWAMHNQSGTLRLVLAMFGVTGSVSSTTPPGFESNYRSVLSGAQALDAATAAYLRSTYFTPDTRALSAMLAEATPNGLVVGGDSAAPCATAAGCYAHLTGSW